MTWGERIDEWASGRQDARNVRSVRAFWFFFLETRIDLINVFCLPIKQSKS